MKIMVSDGVLQGGVHGSANRFRKTNLLISHLVAPVSICPLPEIMSK